MDILNDIMDKLDGFVNLFDSIRIVDPANKLSVVKSKDGVFSKSKCYSLWLRGEACPNCISMRALLERETFFKIEYRDGRICLITAAPLLFYDNLYIVEIIKDITDKNIFFNSEEIEERGIITLIEEMNKRDIKDKVTGVFNREYTNERLYFDLKINLMNNKKLNGIFINIINYEKIDQIYGQIVSESIVRSLANILEESIKGTSAWVSRYSEDEFFIALNNSGNSSAKKLLSEIKYMISEKLFAHLEVKIHLEISLVCYGFSDFSYELYDLREDKNQENIVNFKCEKEESDKCRKLKRISVLDKYIDEIRDVLNEVSVASQNFGLEKEKLIISQCLDELIVEYCKCK